MKKIYAKSGETILLTDHSKNVSKVSLSIMDRLPKEIKDDINWRKVIEVSSLLHDIGKSPSEFQKNLKKGIDGYSKNKFRHNEIGWAFCYRYLNVSLDILNPILYNIYWHHGISNKMCNHSVNDILKTISEEDINNMKTVLIELLDQSYLLSEERDTNELTETKTPQFYYEIKEYDSNWPAEKLMINRLILIPADQIQSKFESNVITSTEDYINKIITKSKKINTSICPDGYDISRHNTNIEIAKSCTQTTIINGPGGMGKTDIGIHWNTLSDKPFINVCPMNLISHSVYNNSLSINKNYNLHSTLQLFLTSEVVKSNIENEVPFSSNINVTNIDNFVRPQVDDKSDNHIERLLLLLFADIQIDEYHELIMDASLFRLLIIIMRMRHNYTDARTLLTSATPMPISQYWDSIDENKKTTILPEPNKHYPAPHNKKFKINVLENTPTKEDVKKNNSLIIFNSIREAQRYKKIYVIDELVHSDFNRDEVNRKLQYLYDYYGKQSQRTLDKPNVLGTRIIQTSIDMSFENLYESVCSPQDTFQRIPRINRWGDYENTICELNFFKAINSTSENNIKSVLYNRNLSDNWFNVLKKLNGKLLTLDELNETYNKFNKENNQLIINSIIKPRYTSSCESLTKLYPIRFDKSRKKSNVVIAGSNKLRTDGNEIMVTAKTYGEKGYCDPICQRIYSTIERDFNEDGNVRNNIVKVYKEFVRTGDIRFEVNDILDNENKITLEELRRQGVKSNTPYVRFDKVYHRKLGLVRITDLDEFI